MGATEAMSEQVILERRYPILTKLARDAGYNMKDLLWELQEVSKEVFYSSDVQDGLAEAVETVVAEREFQRKELQQ